VSYEVVRVAGPFACLGLALLLVATDRRARAAGLAACLVGFVVGALPLVPSQHVPLVAGGVAAALAAAAALVPLLRRWPWLLAFLALAFVPVRIPVHVGGSSTKLLLPLYVLAAAAVLGLAWALLRGDARVRELGPLALPLAAFVAWTGLSAAWTNNPREATIELLAFYLPFAILAVGIARLPWSPRALAGLYVELIVLAVGFALVGGYQWVTRDVFWNPKVLVGNAYAPFYRVNSVFWDPSIYGRFLVIAIVASLVVVLRGRASRWLLLAAAAVVVTWLGLLISFSQSSFAALIVAVLGAAAVVWRWRAAAVAGLVAVVLVSVGFSAPQVRHELLKRSESGWNNATSDRASLVANGIRIAVHHPVVGVGVAGFRTAYAARLGLKGKRPKSAASHNTAVTVAAETGLPGLVLLLWLVVVAIVTAMRRLSRSLPDRVGLVVGLSLAAIAVHSLFYNAFFEDPTTWGLFGLAALVAAAPRREETAT
jgi:putative inorganic carbon (HCO3(-)) transporter